MGGSYVPEQRNWRFYENNAAEPSVALAALNTKPTLADHTSIIRLRVVLNETGGKKGTNTYKIYVSTTGAFSGEEVELSTSAAFNYANGLATEGDTVTSYLATHDHANADALGEYHESGTGIETHEAN